MKLTEEQERNLLLDLINRADTKGHEAENVAEVKRRVQNAEIEQDDQAGSSAEQDNA